MVPRSPEAQHDVVDQVGPIRIVKGLDVPIAGEPEQTITDGPGVASVAVLGGDSHGLRPAMRVEQGDRVKLGEPLFADRRHPAVVHTAPGGGVVRAVNRGARRALLSVVIDLDGDDEVVFDTWPPDRLAGLRRDQVAELLLAAGLWTAFRTRPYSKVPAPDTIPRSIFVTALDSNPLAAKAEQAIDPAREDFAHGLTVVSRLTTGRVFVCHAPRADLPSGAADNVIMAAFSGPHPSGLVGTHIHTIDPVGPAGTVWHLGYQDVIAIGRLFTTGRLRVERIVALAGPAVDRPRLIRTRLGASTDDLTRGEMPEIDCRVVSGSVLSGREARGPVAYLGRYHDQVTVLAEGHATARRGGYSSYSLTGTAMKGNKRFAMTTARHGEPVALVPLGGYERVMPLDILPTQLLRALLVGDTEMAQALGCLELDEEDLALCGFVSPSKTDYGPLLRACLERIEKDG